VPFLIEVVIPLIIAHRGASAEKPENTLPAFRRAVSRGADGIELDVQLTSDGVPVVFHDPNLRRLTGQPGRLTAKTWRELRPLRVLGSTARIPRLVEVLAYTRGRIVVQIELKRGTPVAPVLAAVAEARARAWVVLASFESSLVREAADLAPSIPRMLISEGRGSVAGLGRLLVACGAQGISVNRRAIRRPEFVHHFHARGFVVWAWTVNDVPTARRLIGWGTDGLVGDNPALLKGLI